MQRWQKIRALAPAGLAVVAAAAFTGCEPMRSLGLRQDAASEGESAYEQIAGSSATDPEDPKSIFRGKRIPGGLSDEAREIEREFNVY
jgi:hypothetical protein